MNKHIGSALESLFEEMGELEDVELVTALEVEALAIVGDGRSAVLDDVGQLGGGRLLQGLAVREQAAARGKLVEIEERGEGYFHGDGSFAMGVVRKERRSTGPSSDVVSWHASRGRDEYRQRLA